MNLIGLARFFYKGPGIILIVVGVVIAVAYAIKEGRDRQAAEDAKHQVQRPLGQVNAPEQIDKSKAAKEVVLSGRIVPGAKGSAQFPPFLVGH